MAMERLEGLLRNLKPSEAERRGVKLGVAGNPMPDVEVKALGKVFSEKPASVDGLKATLGKIWCPLKGLQIKALGENIFLFSFSQASGKRKALENGPWMHQNDLMVVEDFDPEKSRDDYQFEFIPVWIHVLKLPLGRMNRETGEAVGDAAGEFLEVDVGEDGMAVGEYLRVKVKLNITNPLLRGMMVQVGADKREKWCPFEYEFLPVFCYTCGLIGHDDSSCATKLGRGESQQFGRWMRATATNKQNFVDWRGWEENRHQKNNRGFGFGSRSGGSGSDSKSWRHGSDSEGGNGPKPIEREPEVTSPMKCVKNKECS
jgi:hypothetical protein